MHKLVKSFLFMTIVATSTVVAQNNSSNPLLQEWNTPHQTPPFQIIENQHYAPAMEIAIKEAKKNIENIIKQKEEPTFDNTILALEQSSEVLDRISSVLFNLNECNTNPELQKIVMDLSPKLTRYSTEIYMNQRLFERVKKLYDNRSNLSLTPEQNKLLENTYIAFQLSGATLSKDNKKKYASNAEKLSMLTQQFNQNVLADNNNYILHITQKEDLSGLPENVIAAAKEEAESRNLQGWVFTLAYPSYGPFLTYADNRSLREQIWKQYNSRGNRGNENDNNKIIQDITQLRYQQAKLLGYKDYASYSLSRTMMENTEKWENFMKQLITASFPIAKADFKEVQDYAKAHGAEFDLMPWDFSFYSQKLKKEKYDFDAELLRPYFSIDSVREGIFNLYGKLYGLNFQYNPNIPVYHPDVKAYEVFDHDRFMAVLYLDMHPRASKRSGAWMTEFRNQSNINGKQIRPLIQVVCNFSKPIGDKPALLSFDEVETFMHEFGHAIHGMLSDVTYPSISGTSVYRDFVELPSQVMENWASEPEFLNTFAKHYQTHDTMPAEYIQKIKRSENFLSGYYCIRQINLGLVDMAFHMLTEPLTKKAEEFEREHMIAIIPFVEGTNTSTAFTHIFAGGYAAGYYSYKWSEVLDADVFSKFKREGIFNTNTADKFRKEILSKGGTEHPAQLFRNFMGREPQLEALLIRSGFIATIEQNSPNEGLNPANKIH